MTRAMPRDIDYVLAKLDWMRRERIWPNGLRYLWTDAFGVVLLVSLRDELGDDRFLDEAEWVVSEVDRVLGRPRGIRIGEEPDRDGQYYHYLAMWLFALWRLGQIQAGVSRPGDRAGADDSSSLRHPGRGRAVEDARRPERPLSGLRPGGARSVPRDGRLSPARCRTRWPNEIAEMQQLVEQSYPRLHVTQDLGLGMLLWMSHFFPREPWAVTMRQRSLATLDRDVDRSAGLLLPRAVAAARQVRLHQLRRLDWPASRRRSSRPRRAAESTSSRLIAPATSTTATPSRTSWPVVRGSPVDYWHGAQRVRRRRDSSPASDDSCPSNLACYSGRLHRRHDGRAVRKRHTFRHRVTIPPIAPTATRGDS